MEFVKMTHKVIDIRGNKYGRLTVLGYMGKGKWYCECICGNFKMLMGQHLRRNSTKSCGCICKEGIHGLYNSVEYRTWYGIKGRCYNTKHPHYHNYGGRGIVMSDSWKLNVVNFYSDMGKRPSNNHSIERIDVNGNYCKENCKWATRKEQDRNRRDTVIINYKGNNVKLIDICEELNLEYKTISARIYKLKWSGDKAIDTPVHKKSSHIVEIDGFSIVLNHACKILGLHPRTIRNRIRKYGYGIKEAFTIPIKKTPGNTIFQTPKMTLNEYISIYGTRIKEQQLLELTEEAKENLYNL